MQGQAEGLSPRCYYADTNRDGTRCLLLLQDLAPHRSCDQLKGCSLVQAQAAFRYPKLTNKQTSGQHRNTNYTTKRSPHHTFVGHRHIAKFHVALYNHHDLLDDDADPVNVSLGASFGSSGHNPTAFVQHYNAPVFKEGMGLFRQSIPIWVKKFSPPDEAVALIERYADRRDEFIAAIEAGSPALTIVHGACSNTTSTIRLLRQQGSNSRICS